MQAKNFISKYTSANNKKGQVSFYKIKATEKWVEYMLDITDMNRVLMALPFNDKMRMLDGLEVAERKRDYMYRHPNFNLKTATYLFSVLKDAAKVPDYTPKKRG
jgi:hypothetical protein